MKKSQCQLAYELGVTPNTVARWERYEVTPSAQNIVPLARLLRRKTIEVLDAVWKKSA